MQSFILQQNKARFLHLLQNEADDERRATLNGLLRAAERDLAFLQSLREGAGTTDRPRGQPAAFTPEPQIMAGFRETFGLSPKLCMALDAGPGLHIIEVNDAFVQESLHGREALVGKPLFSTFPDNPDDPAATGVSALYASLRMAVATGETQFMPLQRYDVQSPDGAFVERYWRVTNGPVYDDRGRLLYILQQTERVTLDGAPAG